MTLVRTSILNAIAVFIRLLTAVGLNKVLAIYVGPGGYALLGQFQNAIAMLTTFGSGAMNAGVTKYTAEHFDDESHQRMVWRTAGTVSLSSGLVLSLLVFLARYPLSVFFFSSDDFSDVFVWLACTLLFLILNGLLLAVLNGKKSVKRYVFTSIAGSLMGFAVTGVLAVHYGLHGALIAMTINQSLVFFVTLASVWRLDWFRPAHFWGGIDRDVLKGLGKFMLMGLVAATVAPVTQIAIRKYLIATQGLDGAGYWDGLNRISAMYLSLATATLELYFLPRFSEIRERQEMVSELRKGYLFVIPLVAIGAGMVYALRYWVVSLLFTPAFKPMGELFGWQMVGDVIRMAGWLGGYALLARGRARVFIGLEIASAFIWTLLAVVLVNAFGMQGAMMAYAAHYLLYLLAVLWFLLVPAWDVPAEVVK